MHTALDRIQSDPNLAKLPEGRIGYLCHSASVDRNLRHGADIMHNLYGTRLTALFGPQHGLNTDAQDNMIESPHFEHPQYQIPVFSLYSETRVPTKEMLSHIDTLIIDLQDVGVRVYTYIWTMVLAMRACAANNKKVIILDRPNPLNGITVEGNISKPEYQSFVGLHPLPMRHGMSLGEVARFANLHWDTQADLTVIECEGWDRSHTFATTSLPWVPPSPNLSSSDTLSVYPGFVLFEGTTLSEGRGTVRPFEIFGHPAIKHVGWLQKLQKSLADAGLNRLRLRPHTFVPTFEKWQNQNCYGYQVHVHPPDPGLKGSWSAAQILQRELYQLMGDDFAWRQPPFEYITDKMPIDILNGTSALREWVQQGGTNDELRQIELNGHDEFLKMRSEAINN
jgi:uncharacterized protein YbbC (DUF1343 family)